MFIRIDVSLDEGAIRFWVNKKLQGQVVGVKLLEAKTVTKLDWFHFVISFDENT